MADGLGLRIGRCEAGQHIGSSARARLRLEPPEPRPACPRRRAHSIGADSRHTRLFGPDDLGSRRAADTFVGAVSLRSHRRVPWRLAADVPRADPARGLAPFRHPADPCGHQRTRDPVPQPRRHRQAARHHRRSVRRPPHRGRRGGLVAGGVLGARRPSLRRARRGHRRVPPPDEDAVDRGLAALPGQVLPARRRDDAASPGPEASSTHLDRRAYRAGPPPDGLPWRRVASDRAPRSRRSRARRARREGSPDPRAGRPGGAGSGVDRDCLPRHARPLVGSSASALGDTPPAGRASRQGCQRSEGLPVSRCRHSRLRLPEARSVGHDHADAAVRPGSAPPPGPSHRLARPMIATETFTTEARVARLATVDAAGSPHVVPVCYATNGRAYYSPLDAKPKKSPVTRLKRVRNIQANPRVALLIDHYEEDWTRLRFVMVQGRAELLDRGTEWETARTLLETKYPQYRRLPLPPDGPVIKIVPDHVVRWSPDS